MVVVVCDLLGWALSDVPCASITRSGYNLPPPSGQTQSIGCQFLAAAHSSKTEIPFQRPVSSICDWFTLSIKLGLKFKSRARLRRRVVALDIRERGWRRSKTQRCIIHPTEVRIYVRYGVRSPTTASVRLPSESCWRSACHRHPPLLKRVTYPRESRWRWRFTLEPYFPTAHVCYHNICSPKVRRLLVPALAFHSSLYWH